MTNNNRMLELLEFFKTNPPPEEVYERYYAECSGSGEYAVA
jgi:hypothetical protein